MGDIGLEARAEERGPAGLGSFVHALEDAVVLTDGQRRIVLFNAAAEGLFHCAAADAVGQLLERFVPALVAAEPSGGAGLTRGGPRSLEARRSDGEELPVEVSVSRADAPDGARFAIVLRDARARKAEQLALVRLNRLYAARTHVNQAIVRQPAQNELFAKVCDALVAQGGFQMAAIAWHAADLHVLVPVAQSGDDRGDLQSLRLSTEGPESESPIGTAFREQRPCICNDLLSDPSAAPWRAEMERRGYRASAVFPIRVGGAVEGTLSVYADSAGFFQSEETALLSEVAADVSTALDQRELEEKRLGAEAAVRHFVAIVESTDDAILSESLERVITCWNPAAERMFGYSAAEAIGRSMDLLVPPDRAAEEASLFDRIKRGERVRHVETLRVRKSGDRFPASITFSPIWGSGERAREVVGWSKIVRDITERKAAEAVADRERRFANNFIEAMPGISYLYTEEGRFLRWNRNFESLSGYSAAEIAHIHPLDFFAGDDKALVARRIAEVFEAGESSVEASFVAKDGRATPYFLTGKRISFDGMTCAVGVGVDITERKRAEAALSKSEERYRSTLESILEGCQLIGFDWSYLYLNEAAAIQNRSPREALLGRRMFDVWPGIEATPVFDLLRRCMNERVPFRDETEFLFPDGSRTWFDVRAQPVPEGIFVLSIDISERKHAEMALRELNERLEVKVAERTADLEAARERAESADRLKSAFLATMSHELRTPLNSIIGFTGIILQGLAGSLNPEQAKQLGMVQGSARHLLELINDVLDISKIEAGQLEVRFAPFDLRASVARVMASVKPLADKKGLALRAVLPPDLAPLESDRRRVDQILLNLLNNAIKFTDSGSVTLDVALVTFDRSGAGDSEAAVRVSVTDTGIGMKQEDLGMLFQPFRQIDSGLDRQHEGTGLGLAICRRLTGLLGGAIRAESEVGRGSVFTLTLPLLAPRAAPSARARMEAPSVPS